MQKNKSTEQTPMIATFLTCMAVMSLLTLCSFPKNVLTEEKRIATPLPELSNSNISALAKLPQEFQSFFNDRLAFRLSLVSARNALKLMVFGISPVPAVIVGSNQWLYCSNYVESKNNKHLSQHDLLQWKSCLEKRCNSLRKKGISYVFVVVPDKSVLYPQNLPDWLKRSNQIAQSEMAIDYLTKNTNVPIKYLKKDLEDNKNLGQLFHRIDTHWNQLGSFVGTRAVMDVLHAQSPGLRPLNLDNYDIKYEPNRKRQVDLGRQMALGAFLKENNPILTPKSKARKVKAELDRIIDRSKPCFVSSPYTGLPKLLIIGDSFGRRMVPFLLDSFSEIAFYYNRDGLEEAVQKHHPDVVIEECLAPLLVSANPQSWDSALRAMREFQTGTTIFEFEPRKNQLSELQINGCIAKKENGLNLERNSSDPQIILPGSIQFCESKKKVVLVDLRISEIDEIQIFFQTKKNELYSERNSVRKTLTGGNNKVWAELPAEACGRIRIDPGTKYGKCIINKIEIRELSSTSDDALQM